MKINRLTVFLILFLSLITLISADTLTDKLNTDYADKLKEAYKNYNEKNYAEAIKLYREYLEANVNDSGNLYNLACCYGLDKQAENAAEFLVLSVKKGFTDIQHIINDPDFESVKESEVFKKAIEECKNYVPEKKTTGEELHYPVTIYSKCRVYESKAFNRSSDPVLVVSFHGWGDNVDNFSKIGKIFDDFNVVFLSIQAPYAFKSGKQIGYSWVKWFDENQPEDTGEKAIREMLEYVEEAVEDIEKKYDFEKIYVTGFSQGGWLTYLYGILNYKKLDALVPMGGSLDTNILSKRDIAKASDLPVHIIHGNDDKVVNYEEAAKALSVLKEKGYYVELNTFEGAHVINAKLMKEVFSKLLKK